MPKPSKPIPPLTRYDRERFWEKVDRRSDAECWLWKGASYKGYGGFRIHPSNYLPHRVAYRIHYNKDPHPFCVCHHCDVSLCCNPYHLFKGTQSDNIADMVNKGRHRHGERYASKLTGDQVRMIRELYSLGTYTQKELAVSFAVGHTLIGDIILKKKWRSI
jgi:hypothetical protein